MRSNTRTQDFMKTQKSDDTTQIRLDIFNLFPQTDPFTDSVRQNLFYSIKTSA